MRTAFALAALVLGLGSMPVLIGCTSKSEHVVKPTPRRLLEMQEKGQATQRQLGGARGPRGAGSRP